MFLGEILCPELIPKFTLLKNLDVQLTVLKTYLVKGERPWRHILSFSSPFFFLPYFNLVLDLSEVLHTRYSLASHFFKAHKSIQLLSPLWYCQHTTLLISPLWKFLLLPSFPPVWTAVTHSSRAVNSCNTLYTHSMLSQPSVFWTVTTVCFNF